MKRILIIIIFDIILIVLSYLAAFYLRFQAFTLTSFFLNYSVPTLTLAFIYIACLFFKGAYRKRFQSNFELFEATLKSLLLAGITSMSLIFILRSEWGAFPSSIFLISFPVLLLLLSTAHMIMYKLWGSIYRIVYFVGTKELGVVEKLAEKQEIDEIVLTTDNIEIDKLYFLLNLSNFKKAKLSILPEIYDKIIAKKVREEKGDIYALPAYFKNSPEEQLIRINDIALSFLFLFLAFPVIALVALLIKFDSSGPIIYKQERIGKNGRKFILYKFRSMVIDAPLYSRPKEMALEEDSRVTRIGRIIRKSRLDEFPQLFNIIKGDMSLVGPRPEAIYRVKEHRALQGIRLSVKPGLTGLAQIEGYYHTSPHHKLRYDYLYIRNHSLRLNLNILLKTTLVVLLKPGS